MVLFVVYFDCADEGQEVVLRVHFDCIVDFFLHFLELLSLFGALLIKVRRRQYIDISAVIYN